MKKSKIMMGLAVLMFAALGAFATTMKTSAVDSYYWTGGSEGEGQCQSTGISVNCTENPLGGCLGPSGPSAGQQLYNEDCQVKLRPEPGF